LHLVGQLLKLKRLSVTVTDKPEDKSGVEFKVVSCQV